MRTAAVIAVVAVLIATIATGGQLRVGVASVDVTPDKPVRLFGYGSRKDPHKSVHDPLSARAVVFESDDSRLVLLSTDLGGFYSGTAERFRKAICDKYDLEPGQLFLSGIHSHAAPTLMLAEDAPENNVQYTLALGDKLVDLVGKAMDSMAPAKIGAGAGHCPIGSNRRQLVLDGNGGTEIRLGRNPYGVTDKEVTVLKVVADDRQTILFNYATHATSLGPRNYAVSGDVIGLAEQFVEKVLGDNTIAPAFTGASGDIDPWYRVLPEFNERPGWVPEPVLLGTFLGEEVVHVSESITPDASEAPIAAVFATVALPGKDSGNVEVTRDHPTTDLNITVARVGEIGFVGLGAEVLTEIGMGIKAASPYEHTFIITHCNGAAGYLAGRQQHVQGGYEVRTSPFAPTAAEKVTKKAIAMLFQLR